MSEDKTMTRTDHRSMTYEAVVKAAWAADTDFVELCKAMYGPTASVNDVLRAERIAKFGSKKKGNLGPELPKKAKKAKQVINVIEHKPGKGKAFAAGLVVGAAAATDPHTRNTLEGHNLPYIYSKMSPDPSSVHLPGTGQIKRKRKPVLDDRGVQKGLGFEREYKRDDKGRFSSARSIALDSLTSGGTGALAGVAGGKAVGNLNSLFTTLKSTPKGRRALLTALKATGGKGGKAAVLGAAAGLTGAMAGHHGKQAYNDLRDRKELETQHRKDLKFATTALDMDELSGNEATNARVYTRQGDHMASTLITRDGATKYREFGKRAEVDMGGEISEVDLDKHQVFGWASITKIAGRPVVDLQGDFIDDDELEKAAYEYVHKSRVGGAMHMRVDEDGNVISKNQPYHAADLIESVVLTDDKVEKMGISTDRTGWWVGFQVNDEDVWAKVKSGDWKGFSIHGSGRRTPTSLEELKINDAELGR